MGYYDIFNIYENDDWEKRTRREGEELVVEQGNLVCHFCLFPFMRARLLAPSRVQCPLCGREIELSDPSEKHPWNQRPEPILSQDIPSVCFKPRL